MCAPQSTQTCSKQHSLSHYSSGLLPYTAGNKGDPPAVCTTGMHTPETSLHIESYSQQLDFAWFLLRLVSCSCFVCSLYGKAGYDNVNECRYKGQTTRLPYGDMHWKPNRLYRTLLDMGGLWLKGIALLIGWISCLLQMPSWSLSAVAVLGNVMESVAPASSSSSLQVWTKL
ncbi:hypothetical protein EOD39_20535 [Acipenser ruthenus]|uniref:Uncharacterized protein n=1 Tax=Acipenser ruthenus TaxID=7906 RepID=A0A444UVA5_ACIRT|nr:hypothetical protein EOD39_20535 [Acipenser ruthenus]